MLYIKSSNMCINYIQTLLVNCIDGTFDISDFQNMYVHHINYTDTISNSPQAQILEKLRAKKKSSGMINVHISDIMRPIILSKHGGAYMDSDTVSLKPFPSDIKNFMALGKP